MAKGRAKIPDDLQWLLRSEWETVISQASLSGEDSRIAQLCLLDKMPQMDAACELGIHRSTVSRRLPEIIDRMRRTAKRLGYFS
jgi:DNA-directed RNA polymerase specialized sigma subunit